MDYTTIVILREFLVSFGNKKHAGGINDMCTIECEVCRKPITESGLDDLMEVGGKLTCGSIECIKKEVNNIEKRKV